MNIFGLALYIFVGWCYCCKRRLDGQHLQFDADEQHCSWSEWNFCGNNFLVLTALFPGAAELEQFWGSDFIGRGIWNFLFALALLPGRGYLCLSGYRSPWK